MNRKNKALISDAELARIRAAAHEYLLAGGAIYLGGDDPDRHDWIERIRERQDPSARKAFNTQLDRELPSGPQHQDTHQAHEAIWSAVWVLVAANTDAGYLFGVSVGLELAALSASARAPHQKPAKVRR